MEEKVIRVLGVCILMAEIPVANFWMQITFLLCFLMSFDERKKLHGNKAILISNFKRMLLQKAFKYADKALHRAKLPLRVQVEEAGSWNETGCDPWSVRALKNTRMKRNQRIVNILYRIPISLKWEFSLNAHLHRDHSFISFYRGLSVPSLWTGLATYADLLIALGYPKHT